MMDVSHWRLRAGLSAGTRRREGSTWGRAVAVSRIRGDRRSLWPESLRTSPRKIGRLKLLFSFEKSQKKERMRVPVTLVPQFNNNTFKLHSEKLSPDNAVPINIGTAGGPGTRSAGGRGPRGRRGTPPCSGSCRGGDGPGWG